MPTRYQAVSKNEVSRSATIAYSFEYFLKAASAASNRPLAKGSGNG